MTDDLEITRSAVAVRQADGQQIGQTAAFVDPVELAEIDRLRLIGPAETMPANGYDGVAIPKLVRRRRTVCKRPPTAWGGIANA